MKKSQIILGLLTCALVTTVRADHASDRQIEKDIKATYNYRTMLHGDVNVSVDNGVAKLTGKVDDSYQKQLAADTASSLTGVTRVDNQLKVASEPKEKSDDWIKFKAKTELLVKSNVSGTHTTIDVTNGVVTLSGTADSMAQKELTEAYVKDIDGVKSVKNELTVVDKAARDREIANRVAVKTDAAADKVDRTTDKMVNKANRAGESMGDKIDDSSITAQVKYALLSHRSTSALRTKVNTINGKVILSGDAASSAEKDLVTQLAKSVRGVDSVDNNMMVRKNP